MKDFNVLSGTKKVTPENISKNYDVQSAFSQLQHWGWDQMYPTRKLTKSMVEKWAKEHRHGWRLHSVMRKMVISEQDLLKILKGY